MLKIRKICNKEGKGRQAKKNIKTMTSKLWNNKEENKEKEKFLNNMQSNLLYSCVNQGKERKINLRLDLLNLEKYIKITPRKYLRCYLITVYQNSVPKIKY